MLDKLKSLVSLLSGKGKGKGKSLMSFDLGSAPDPQEVSP
jgi:hypothetical protein